MKKILFFFLLFFSLYAKNTNKNVSLASLLIKAKETTNIQLKKELIKKTLKIKPTLYAIKMLLEIDRKDIRKSMQIVNFAYDLFPLNKYLTIKGIKLAFKLNDLNKAEFYLFNYLKVYPLDKDVLYLLVKFYNKKGEIDNSIKILKTIYQLYGDKKALEMLKQINSIFE